MAKIVKYCSSCEEGFAAKFGFCPNCGAALQAFEMVPQIGNTNPTENAKISDESAAAADFKNETIETPSFTPESVVQPVPNNESENVPFAEVKEPISAKPELAAEPKIEAAPAAIDVPAETFAKNESEAKAVPPARVEAASLSVDAVEPKKPAEKTRAAAAGAGAVAASYAAADAPAARAGFSGYQKDDDGFHITVIEEKNVKQRNVLLLGTLAMMLVVGVGGMVYSLFNRDLLVGAIQQEGMIALVPEVEPVPVDEEPPPPKKQKDDGGGGGGGGRDEPTEVQKGRLATQEEKPLIAPDKSITQVTNPAIAIQAATQGNIKRPITNEPYGLPNGKGVDSNGMGTGGGMGSGRGTGMGSGIGTGEGSGIGSGSGSGNGNGNGNGTGNGTGGAPPPIVAKPKPPAVTTPLRIVSKPKALYTDEARQNQVQGTVRLRVTFLASGQIGSISSVSGMPYGLTEKAIAAAKNIKFEPQMADGVPKTVVKVLEYSFTIY